MTLDYALLSTLFIVGLIGSGHCIGMCGGIVAALGSNKPSSGITARLQHWPIAQLQPSGGHCGWPSGGSGGGALSNIDSTAANLGWGHDCIDGPLYSWLVASANAPRAARANCLAADSTAGPAPR